MMGSSNFCGHIGVLYSILATFILERPIPPTNPTSLGAAHGQLYS